MSSPPFGFPVPAGPYSGLRRSVIDPETGLGLVTSEPTGAVMQRSSVLPIGRDDSGRLVPAVPGLIADAPQAIASAVTLPRDAWRGEVETMPTRMSREEGQRVADLAGLAMTGSLPFKAPKGALRMFGGAAAKDDPLAALEMALKDIPQEAPRPGPRLLDPQAKSWDVFHGSPPGEDFTRFDPTKNANPHEHAVFFAPSGETASDYAGKVGSGGEAGARVFRATVEPGKTAVFDLTRLAETDPAFNARAREITVEGSGAAHGASWDEHMAGFRAARAQDADIARQIEEMGFAPDPNAGTRISYGHGHIGAAIERARAQGLDTAILRGLVEHGGDDQAVALTPGRVRSAYSDALLYSTAPAGLGLAAAALASPSDAQAAVPSQGAPSVTGSPFGLPAGFRAMPIPNADPDDPRRLLRQGPFDPSQAPPLVPVQGMGEPPGAAADAQASPPARAGLAFGGAPMPFSVSPSDLAAGRMPGSPPIAMDETETQRLERATGMVSDAGPMPGSPRVLPRHEPTPQPAPARAGLASAALSPPAADLPAPGAQPMMAAPQAMSAPPAGTSAGPAAAAPAAGEPGFFDKAMSGIQQSNGLLTHIGMGLMSTHGFGNAVAAGLKSHQTAEQTRAVTDLAKARFGLEARKAGRETLAENATARLMSQKLGIPYEQALGFAGNKEFVNGFLRNNYSAPEGWQRTPDGLAPIPGGPQDLATKEEQAAATARGTESAKPVKASWKQVQTPDGGTMVYNEADPAQNQLLVPGQKVRPATPEERQAFGVQPGQAARWSDKDGPVPIGQPERPETRTFERPDGTKETRILNRRTGQWDAPQMGGGASSGPQTVANPFSGGGKFNNEQGKAAGFTDRMMGSEETLRELEDINNGFFGGMAGAASGYTPNVMKSNDRQRFEQAQRDFVNSQLRRESGAAISEKEFDNARKQYFPQPGDGADVIEQKRQNRQRSIEAMGREGGPSYRPRNVFDPSGAIVPYRPPTTATTATSAAPSRAQVEAEARRRGLIP